LSAVCTGKKEEADLTTFAIKGEVVAVDTTQGRVTISHEEIPDFMVAMIMPFKVKDPALLRDIAPGDSVLGTLAVSRTESWLAALSKFGSGAPLEVLSAGDIQMHRLLKPGDVLPDLTFLDQEGRSVRLAEFKGRTLALTFIYTRCPLPEFCIRMSEFFARIQKELMRDRSLEGQWHLLTVSFDPVFDRPTVMKQYGENYGADFNRWSFLTDPDTSGGTVLRLADGFDMLYENDEGGLISHNLRTALVDKNGRLAEVIRDNEWKPAEVASKLKNLMRGDAP
jgi:protein SCO1/2